MAGLGQRGAVANNLSKIKLLKCLRAFLSQVTGSQYLLHGIDQTVGILQHDAVETLALRFIQVARLQRFQVKTDGGDRRLQFMSDSIDKAVMLFAAAHLAHQKYRVQGDPGDDESEEDNAKSDHPQLTPVDHPRDVERQREGD
jgi:hypothetical protein